MMHQIYETPDSVEELFENGDDVYYINSPGFKMSTADALDLFIELVGITDIELIDSNELIVNDEEMQLNVYCDYIGNAYLHRIEVNVIDNREYC